MQQAASLPLGSISPQSSSMRVSLSPGLSPAEVPIMVQARYETLTIRSQGRSLSLSEMRIAPRQVNILVRDAIYLRTFEFTLRRGVRSYVKAAQERASTLARGVLWKWGFIRLCLLSQKCLKREKSSLIRFLEGGGWVDLEKAVWGLFFNLDLWNFESDTYSFWRALLFTDYINVLQVVLRLRLGVAKFLPFQTDSFSGSLAPNLVQRPADNLGLQTLINIPTMDQLGSQINSLKSIVKQIDSLHTPQQQLAFLQQILDRQLSLKQRLQDIENEFQKRRLGCQKEEEWDEIATESRKVQELLGRWLRRRSP